MDKPYKFYHFLAPSYWPTWLGMGLLRLIILLPHSMRLKIGAFFGWLIYHLVKERRLIAQTNIRLCFPDLSDKAQQALIKSSFTNLGISIIEAALSWWGSEKQLKPFYDIEGLEHVQTALQQGKPVILLSGHITCSELAARMFSFHSPFQALYKRANNKLFDSIMLNARNRLYGRVVERKETKKLIRGLKNLIPTWYAPDQNFAREEIVFVPFFGVPTATLTATSRLAKITKAAVIPFFPYRENERYKITLGKPLENFPSDDLTQDAIRVNQLIEDAVRKSPASYMWVHKRFRTRPPGEEKIY